MSCSILIHYCLFILWVVKAHFKIIFSITYLVLYDCKLFFFFFQICCLAEFLTWGLRYFLLKCLLLLFFSIWLYVMRVNAASCRCSVGHWCIDLSLSLIWADDLSHEIYISLVIKNHFVPRKLEPGMAFPYEGRRRGISDAGLIPGSKWLWVNL